MSLKGVHIIFMSSAIGLSAGFAFWAFRQFQNGGHPGLAWTSGVTILLTGSLVVYLVQFARKVPS